MIRKLIGSIVIFAVILVVILCFVLGKDTVSGIAENVLDAAKEELAEQIEAKLSEHKVDVIEVKPVVGKLNDEGGEYQFCCAALIRTNSEDSAADCANALRKVFGQAEYMAQTDRNVESEHLVHKSIAYTQTDFSEGNYYTVCIYVSAIDDIIDLDALAEKIKK